MSARVFVTLQCVSTKIEPKTGRPYCWCHTVDEANAERVARDIERRWPDTKVTIEART